MPGSPSGAPRSPIPGVQGTTNRVVNEAFAEERPHLIALSRFPYDAMLTEERRVSHDGMVSVDGNLYSVPDTARKRVLEIQHHPGEVRIFEAGELIARHPVLEGKNQRRVEPGHCKPPPAHHARQQSATVSAPTDMVVTPRPLAFHDAVAQRMAAGEAVQ